MKDEKLHAAITKNLDNIVGAVALAAFFLLLFEQSHLSVSVRYIIRRINIGVLLLFLCDVMARIALSPSLPAHIRRKWFDLIVFVPLIQFIPGVHGSSFFVVVRQIVIVVMLISRTRRTKNLIAGLGLRPAQLMITSFFFAICVGALLLSLPFSTVSGKSTSLTDAFFTATSATCVTGLIVKDTATHFTFLGQLVILALIQLGGLGIMTFSVGLAVLTGKRMQMQQRIVMHDVLDQESLSGATRLIMFIVRMTFSIEAVGALALAIVWWGRFGSVQRCFYHAVFHSISAFCNAGFSTFSDSLMGFSGDIATNAVICALIIAGGLGFFAVRDLFENARGRFLKREHGFLRLKIQTRIVIAVSLLLIAIGALGLFAFEAAAPPAGDNLKANILVAVFQSVSTRTAGFNTVDIGRLSSASLLLVIILMFIGASPGSTGGGLKTTTFAVLWASMMNGYSRNEQVEIYKRTIPPETLQKASTLLLFYILIVLGFVIALLLTEGLDLMRVLFESVSAVATVGLSTGITGQLSKTGRVLITLLMFIGRLGPLTIGYALVLHRPKSNYRYAEERVMIG